MCVFSEKEALQKTVDNPLTVHVKVSLITVLGALKFRDGKECATLTVKIVLERDYY